MKWLRAIAAAALAVASVAAFADWYCPVLNRSFDFPFGWPEGSSSPPLTMDSKYAKVATDAGLEYYRQWMLWNGSYIPANQQALAARTLSDKLLPRDFVAGTFGKFGSLVNDDYHAVYGSGEMTNEVLAFAFNTEIDIFSDGSSTYGVDDLRRVPSSSLFPNIGGEQSRSPADIAISNALANTCGVQATPLTPFYYDGASVDLATILGAWDYMASWSLAMEYRQLEPPDCLQAGSFYPIVNDPWRSYLRHYHYRVNDIPHMLFRCRGRTPFNYTETEDWQVSSTYYYCELTTNDDATATLKLNYVLFEHTTSNAYSLTRPLFYGERVTGEAQAEGTAYGVALGNLQTAEAVIGQEFWRDVYIEQMSSNVHCCLWPVGYRIAEERDFGTKLDYRYKLKKYAIAKRANYENAGFPASTSAYDCSNVWTLYQYDSDGSDYYGNPATYSGKGVENSGTVMTNDPYYVDHYFNSQAFDSDVYYMSEALHPTVGIEVYYDQGDPEFTLGPYPVPNAADKCLVTYNHRPAQDGGVEVDVAGWMYTNTWNFVYEPSAWWGGITATCPKVTEVVYPQYYEKDGDALYELSPWQLPFTFAVDMFSKWVSNRWGMWE